MPIPADPLEGALPLKTPSKELLPRTPQHEMVYPAPDVVFDEHQSRDESDNEFQFLDPSRWHCRKVEPDIPRLLFEDFPDDRDARVNLW